MSTQLAVATPQSRAVFLGRLASVTQVIFALIIAALASFRLEPGFVPRGVVLLGFFALPGLIGLLGTAARRPALLLGAGLTSAIGSLIAFSGVTLIFLMPAFLFVAAALRTLALPATPQPGSAAVNLVGWLARAGAAVAIVVLVVGAGASALLITDSACWSVIQTPSEFRLDVGPYSTGEIGIPEGATSTSCATGIISARGVGLGGSLAGVALGLAALAARRPPEGA